MKPPTAIPETVSEKRTRGRPKAWHADGAHADHVFDRQNSERAKQNGRLAFYAMCMLTSNWRPEFAWFWKLGPMSHDEVHAVVMGNKAHRVRWTVLAELGRLRHEEDLLHVAATVASWPSSTTSRDAAISVRAFRLGLGKVQP